jgi:hypothetical protein
MPSDSHSQSRSSFRKHPHLYEINTWAWLEELSACYGRPVTLGSVPDEEWEKLRKLGFDFIWLMGVWKRSALGRRMMRTDPSYFASYDAALPGWTMTDIVGSPYAIQDYIPDPRMGSWNDLDMARDQLHRRGMGLVLDFVPNHTGLDHPWISTHPEYYIQGNLEDFRKNPSAFFLVERENSVLFIARGKDPYFPAWPDTAQLNYYEPATRAAMLGVLRTIAPHCDGVRCDMAMLCLNDVFARTWGSLLTGFKAPPEEFWPSAVAALPDFIWIGEVYWDLEWRLQQLGLTFTYDKRLYDRLLNSPPEEVRLHLKADVTYQSRLARFLENHDEARSAQAFGRERLPAVATLTATLPGMHFYHHGQLEGKRLHLPIQLRCAATEPPQPEIQALYAKLLALTQDDVFHKGEWQLLDLRPAGDPSFQNLIAYRWRSDKAWKIVVSNLGASPSQGSILLERDVDPSRHYAFVDQLNDRSCEWSGRDLSAGGLFVRLEAYQSHIFDVAIR